MPFRLQNKKIIREILFFICAGITANILSFLVYIFGIYFLSIRTGLSAFFGQTLALIINYLINSKLSFRSKLNVNGKVKYIIYYSSTILINSISIDILNSYGLSQTISWLICISIFSIINFLFLKYLIFF